MTVESLQLYNNMTFDIESEAVANGIDLANDTIKLALFTSASNAGTLTNATFASLTNEVSGNGYTATGNTLATVVVSTSGGTLTFDSDATVFNASGGDIVARFYVLYSDTPTNKPLIGVALLDDTPADVTVTDGNPMTITPDALGWFTNAAVNV